MRYMIREVFNCQRGHVPVVLEDLKIIVNVMESQGITNHKIYVDIAQSMDTLFHEYEVDSLDKYFEFERGLFVNPDEETKGLLDHYNGNTVAGQREIYEVIM